ncbi:type VI secretion system Vgr family protein, partial [Roseateles sp.]|uniref:type VI secretion system Vgr family protein n=1 Tax=Roseateles sp. TaxID=1971397 RepID=UPI002E07953D
MSSHTLSIETALGGGTDKLLVLRMQGQEKLGRLPEWQVDLVGNVSRLGIKERVDLHAMLGKPAHVVMDLHGVKREFNGHVTRAVRGERHGRYEAFSIVMRPWLWFATRSRNSRVFQDKTVREIVDAVLGPYSSDIDWKLRTTPTYPTLEYCVQYDETDFDFVSRLLEDAGIYYFFKHDRKKDILVLTDGSGGGLPALDKPTLQWANGLKHDESLMDWRRQEEVRSTKAIVRDHDYLASTKEIEEEKAALQTASPKVPGGGEVFEFPAGAVLNQKNAEAQSATTAAKEIAKLRLEELQSLQTVCTGTTNSSAVTVGAAFKLTKALAASDNVDYLVVGMSYRAEFGDHEAIDDLKGLKGRRDGFVADLACIPKSGHPFRPERLTPRPRMHGPLTAEVVGAQDKEIEVDKHGRVKVQFHWDGKGGKDEDSSCWVRVAQPWAGKSMGMWMIPRIGHEVVVSFIGGNPDRPLVTGSVHNDANLPPYELPAHAHASGWVSHSTKEGADDARNELRFCDDKDNEHVWLQAQKAFYRHVKGDTFDHLEMNETRRVGQSVKEVVGGAWSLNVGDDVMHDLGKDLHTTVAGDIFTKGAATWQIKLEKELSVKTATDVSVDADGKSDWKSGGDVHLDSGGVLHLKSTGNLVGESGAKVSLKAASDVVAEGVSVKIKASGEVVIEGTAGIKLVCGGSSIALTSSSVDITGGLVNINCGGGGGSAGSAESAAAASPKEVADAKVLDELKSDQQDDYKKQLADPFEEGSSPGGTAPGGAAGGRPRANAFSA